MNSKYLNNLGPIHRFIFVGGCVTLIQMALIYLFHNVIHFYGPLSSGISFIFIILVNFILQKNWTFQNLSKERTFSQFNLFLFVAIYNFILNICLIYFFTEKLGINLYLAQSEILVLIAFSNFFIYKKIFR